MTEAKVKVCVAGGGGFIGSHLAKRLKSEGFHVVCADWKRNEYFEEHEFCDEFLLVDLRDLSNCIAATAGCRDVYNMAADMGGMGFICSAEAVLFYNNIQISSNMLEGARQSGVKRFFYAGSACCYNETLQATTEGCLQLKESDAWPAQPQDGYGLEKLCTEKLAYAYAKDFGMKVTIGRFHNVYGPWGTWKGGREKAPAAMIRKALVSTKESGMEVWGKGDQIRSFCYIDDCIDGVRKIMESDYTEPLNLGSDYPISMNDLAHLALDLAEKDIPIRNIPGPEGVKGRNSDNTLIKQVLGWAPATNLKDGMRTTMNWIRGELEKLDDAEQEKLTSSKIITSADTVNYKGDLGKEEKIC